MKNTILAAAFVAFGFAASTPAQAVTIIPAKCVSVTDPAGCFYEGNMGNAADAAAAQAQYNAIRNPDIVLNFLGKSDSGFGTVTYGDSSNTFGTWAAPGYTIDYIAVKAGPAFILYKVVNNSWNTDGLENSQGKWKELSHLTFFGTQGNAVPEPATWAMMIGGMGVIGATMRRSRRTKISFA